MCNLCIRRATGVTVPILGYQHRMNFGVRRIVGVRAAVVAEIPIQVDVVFIGATQMSKAVRIQRVNEQHRH